MNRPYTLVVIFLTGCFLGLLACDLERIEPGGGNESKFSTTIGGNGNDFPFDIYPNPDGSFIVAGKTQSFTADMNNDAYLAKVDKAGVVVWEKNFGYSGDDWAKAITPVSDGGYIFCGQTIDPVSFNQNIFLVKVNSSGTEVWRKNYGSLDSIEMAFGIIPAGTSDFLVGYTSTTILTGDIGIKFMRINANGSRTSDKLAVTAPYYYINDMIRTSDNEIVIAGSEFISSTSAYVAKFMEDGTFIWEKNYMGPSLNYSPGSGVVELADKSLVIAASFLGDNDHDFMTIAYTEIGMQQPERIWGGANPDELQDITNTKDGEIVVTGYTQSFSIKNEIYLSKRKASDGAEVWAKHFGETWTQGASVKLCPDGGFVVCTGQNQANADIIVIKTDANGNFQ